MWERKKSVDSNAWKILQKYITRICIGINLNRAVSKMVGIPITFKNVRQNFRPVLEYNIQKSVYSVEKKDIIIFCALKSRPP